MWLEKRHEPSSQSSEYLVMKLKDPHTSPKGREDEYVSSCFYASFRGY